VLAGHSAYVPELVALARVRGRDLRVTWYPVMEELLAPDAGLKAGPAIATSGPAFRPASDKPPL